MKEIIKTNAKALRKNMTQEEKHLWYDFLKDNENKWYRQRPMGNYIADFYCAKAKVIIELDGGQHYEKEGLQKDEIRTEYFKSQGIEVIRFTNVDVNRHFEAVCRSIDECVKKRIIDPSVS